METDLFGNQAEHDAGGKRKIALPPGVSGDAMFHGPNDCRRLLLRRWRGLWFPDHYLMFIATNPSVAAGHVDDPTIVRDWSFTEREGYSAFAKCNIADYRATKPSLFKDASIVPSTDRNLEVILATAAGAAKIIICHGNLSKPLRPLGESVVKSLRAAGHKLYCLGVNKDGSPKHPLYVLGTAPLVEYL